MFLLATSYGGTSDYLPYQQVPHLEMRLNFQTNPDKVGNSQASPAAEIGQQGFLSTAYRRRYLDYLHNHLPASRPNTNNSRALLHKRTLSSSHSMLVYIFSCRLIHELRLITGPTRL
jgi:hypothetical protein